MSSHMRSQMPRLEPHFQLANGTIRRIASNDLVYVELENGGERSVSFTPRVVVGYMGQPLHEFGIRPGESVKVTFDPSSGQVQSAEIISKLRRFWGGASR